MIVHRKKAEEAQAEAAKLRSGLASLREATKQLDEVRAQLRREEPEAELEPITGVIDLPVPH